jgi:hypothetical protein
MHPFLSPHAQARMQQRAISAEALERLLDFGSVQHLARDKDIVFFDKKAKRRLAKADKALVREAERLVLYVRGARRQRHRDHGRAPVPAGASPLSRAGRARVTSPQQMSGCGFAQS